MHLTRWIDYTFYLGLGIQNKHEVNHNYKCCISYVFNLPSSLWGVRVECPWRVTREPEFKSMHSDIRTRWIAGGWARIVLPFSCVIAELYTACMYHVHVYIIIRLITEIVTRLYRKDHDHILPRCEFGWNSKMYCITLWTVHCNVIYDTLLRPLQTNITCRMKENRPDIILYLLFFPSWNVHFSNKQYLMWVNLVLLVLASIVHLVHYSGTLIRSNHTNAQKPWSYMTSG